MALFGVNVTYLFPELFGFAMVHDTTYDLCKSFDQTSTPFFQFPCIIALFTNSMQRKK